MIVLSALMLLISQFIYVVAQAQVADIDIDPPVIDHESLETGVAGELQFFSALVVDDRGVEYVDLYHRKAANTEYLKARMVAVAGTSNYSAALETDPDQTKIEYYIEVADTGGNRVLKGFPFFPLVRNLEAPQAVFVPSKQSSTESATGGSRWLYLALGAVAVGLLANALSSGDDGGDSEPENQVLLTINISSP